MTKGKLLYIRVTACNPQHPTDWNATRVAALNIRAAHYSLRSAVVWVVESCSSDRSQHFGGRHLHLRARSVRNQENQAGVQANASLNGNVNM